MTIRILLADDHAVFRNGLRALLEKEDDIEIVGETGDGPATLAAMEEKEVDILLLDLSMPGISGSRVADAVLSKNPEQAIVILTMHEDEFYMQELFKAGVRGFVVKKSTATDLLLAIRAVKNGGYYIDPTLAGHVITPLSGKAASKSDRALDVLTQREKEVCRLLAYGHTNSEIGDKLGISTRTVDTHRAKIMSKLGMKSRADLVRFAIDNKLMKIR